MGNNHGLRTTGRPTGNFGRNKIQAKKETLDLTKEILSRDNLRIPRPEDGYNKLMVAYNTTTDPKMKAVLGDMLKQRKATLQPTVVKPMRKPRSEYWEMVSNVR